jgi:two-component system CheB/CheR fusion protein
MRVLIADDIPTISQILARLCQRLGCTVVTCNNGADVLVTLEWMRPDALLLDIAMPEVDGLQIARALRERPELRPPILAALTGFGDPVMSRRIAEAGFDHHLVKPVGWQDLSGILKSAAVPAGPRV